MTRQIRIVATGMLLLMGALLVNLNWIQWVRADDLIDNQRNRRLLAEEYDIERGSIVVGEQEVAFSEETDGTLRYLRRYSEPQLYAHLTGFSSFVLQRSGLEAARNDELLGTSRALLAENLVDLLAFRDREGNDVRLTIDPTVQRVARQALGDRTGAVVAMDPRSGAVLASYSNPSFDPNVLSSHDGEAVLAAWGELLEAPDAPLRDRVTRDTHAPGSVFKLVVAAAALEDGIDPDQALEDRAAYTPPQTELPISNFSPGPCGDGATISLRDALRVSCNTVFAELGVDLGGEALVEQAEAFGLNDVIPYDLLVESSTIPKDLDPPATAQSALGQRDVRVTPLQIAVLTSALVNGGEVRRPYVVEGVTGPDLSLLSGPREEAWAPHGRSTQAVSVRTAELLRSMMVDVVASGTGGGAQVPGAVVGGKTGTAQVPGATPTVWFTGFANDEVVVTVVLPDAGEGATGGGAAAPIARSVMEAAL